MKTTFKSLRKMIVQTEFQEKTGEKSDSVKEMDERVLRYYEQIDALRKQLDDVNKQRRVLVEKMQSGTSTEELMSELTTLNGQSRSINSNINMVFASIMQLEQSIESENLSNMQSSIGVSKTASLNGTSAVASVSQGLSSNAKVDTQTGKKLAEAVVSCINTNGSTKGWCLTRREQGNAKGIRLRFLVRLCLSGARRTSKRQQLR